MSNAHIVQLPKAFSGMKAVHALFSAGVIGLSAYNETPYEGPKPIIAISTVSTLNSNAFLRYVASLLTIRSTGILHAHHNDILFHRALPCEGELQLGRLASARMSCTSHVAPCSRWTCSRIHLRDWECLQQPQLCRLSRVSAEWVEKQYLVFGFRSRSVDSY